MSKFRLIEAEKANHPISLMCEMLGVSRSGFHAWRSRPPFDRQLTDAWLLERIGQIHSENRGVYGAPRVHAELRCHMQALTGQTRQPRTSSELLPVPQWFSPFHVPPTMKPTLVSAHTGVVQPVG